MSSWNDVITPKGLGDNQCSAVVWRGISSWPSQRPWSGQWRRCTYSSRLCSRHFSWSCLTEKVMPFDCWSSSSEPALCLRVYAFSKRLQSVEHHTGEGLPHETEERNSTEVVTVAAIIFASWMMMLASSPSRGTVSPSQHRIRSWCRWWNTAVFIPASKTYGGIPSSFLRLMPQARESMALLSSSTEGGSSSSSMMGSLEMLSTAVSVTVFSWYYVASSWLQWRDLGGTKGLFHAIIHAADVTRSLASSRKRSVDLCWASFLAFRSAASDFSEGSLL